MLGRSFHGRGEAVTPREDGRASLLRDFFQSTLRRLKHWLASGRRGWAYLVLFVVSLRVVFWLPPGYSPDNANSFSPSMPLVSSPLSNFGPWINATDGGYLNPSIPHAIDAVPQLALSTLGFSTWTAQCIWLVLLYFLGSLLASEAFREIFRNQVGRWLIVASSGIAYQLSPSLIYGLQDTAAYGLPISFFWGIPLLVLLGAYITHRRWRLVAPFFGAATLLFFAEFPTSLVLAPILGVLILAVVGDRAATSGLRLSALAARTSYFVLWAGIFNLWWLLPELQYHGQLLSTLQTSTPPSTVYSNHLFYLLALNWDWPQISSVISYQSVGVSLAAGLVVAIVAFSSVLAYRSSFVGLIFYAIWLLLFIPLYGYSQPVGPYYVGLLHQSTLLNLIRNPVRFEFLFAFLFAMNFATGAALVASTLRRIVLQRSERRPARDTLRSKVVRTVPIEVVVTAFVVLVLAAASLPLVNGDVVVNTTYNGSTVLPATPSSHGVRVPGFYAQASTWLMENHPGATKFLLPMPGTWLSAGSRLSWGYEGGAAIYQTLLPPPLIMNQAGTLTQPAFPAVSAAYGFAAAGGSPGPPVSIPMNGTISVWSGYAGDSVRPVAPIGSGGTVTLDWTVNLSRNYGPNGHIFTQTVRGLPAGAAYFGFWITSPEPGRILFGWANETTSVGWYPVSASSTSTFALVSASLPPPINYNASFPARGFANASQLAFSFIPSGPPVNRSVVIRITNYTAYVADPRGMEYYLESLGADLVVVDSSIVASSPDSLQNLSNYEAVLRFLSPDRVANFGNLTIYSLPGSLPMVSGANFLSPVWNYSLAWSDRESDSPYFAVDPPDWVGTQFSSIAMTSRWVSDSEVQVAGTCGGRCMIVLLQNFDSLWAADSSTGLRLAHLEVNGWANAWLVNSSGPFSLTIELTPQTTLVLSLFGSITAGFILVLLSPVMTVLRARIRPRG
jgi:hypothetical protein